MSNFCTGYGLVLMWGIFQSPLGAEQGICPVPQTIKFAEVFAEWYALGAHISYECDVGYQRLAGSRNYITCKNQSGQAQWTCRKSPTCIARSELTSGSPQKLSTKTCEGSPSSSQITIRQIMEGVCQVPKPLAHATIKVNSYGVGQKLQYRCLEGYRAWSVISEISTCEDSNGRGVWSRLSLRCTNDSSSVTEGARKPQLSSASSPSKDSPTKKLEELVNGSQTTSEQVWKAVFTIAGIATVILS